MDSLLKRIEKNRKAHIRWLAMVLCLSMIVSLGTFAGFHQTAVAKTYTKEVLDCPYTHEGAEPVAHVHNDDCYDGETLVCTLPEREAHTHTDECFTEQQRLTCTLAENPGHQHGDACYAAREENVCGLEENPGHVHNGTCFNDSGVLICTMAEGDGAHAHTADCFTTVYDLICEIPEGEGAHTHTEECYTTERVQVCGKAELPVHVHGAECVRTVEWTEGDEEPAAADEQTLNTVPEMPVSDPNADLETAEDWNREFEDFELSGNWANDLVLVAATQQGRGESPNNFEAFLNDAGDAWVRHGYTRYGAWYGVPYAEEWSAMFVSFCLRYAGIPAENVPNNPTAALMAESFSKGELFAGRDYVPAVGDLIFFDTVDDEIVNIDHMGIVYHVDAEDGTINTVEGDRTDAVATFGYHLDDEQIVGYGILPQNPDYNYEEEITDDETDGLIVMTEEEEKNEESADTDEATVPSVPMPAQSWERTAGGIKVTVDAPEGAFPENTSIAVTPVNGNSLKDTVSDAVSGEVLEVQAVDITFFDANGHEIEPAIPIRVVMTPVATQHAEEKTSVVHVDLSQQTAELVEQAAGTEFDNSEVVFDADAFTIYAIVYTYQVEYEYEVDGKTFTSSMPGAENMTLTQIVQGLDIVDENEIETFVSKIASIASSNEEVAVVNENNEIRVLKDGEAKIVITMQDGAKFHIDVRAEGETSTSNETATISTKGDLYLPADAELKTEVLDEVKSESAIAAVEAKEGTADSNAAAAETAYQVFDISLENVEADQYDGFQVEVKIPEGVVGRNFRLYHVHDGKVDELELDNVAPDGETVLLESVSFVTPSFSEFVLSYTVDFEYQGRTWSFPGQGSYLLTDVLGALGIEGIVDEATLTLVEGEELEGALYLTQVDGEYYINSDVPFFNTYELRVSIGDEVFQITVTDAQETTNLNNLVSNFNVSGAVQNPDGSYTVVPGKSYSTDITFNESERTYQFSDHGEMEYTLPEGITLGGITSPFDISFNYLGRRITISGNTARVEGNKLYIKFNDQDTEYSKFQSITTAQIKVHADVVFSNNENEYVIQGGGTYKVDTKADVNLTKTGKITNFDTGEVKYTLNLTSNGSNSGVDIKDVIEGDALSLVSGSVKMYDSAGNQVNISVTENPGGTKGFKFNTGALQDGNYRIEYTAHLDKNALTPDGNAKGKADDTKNTVTYGPDDKTTTHNLGHVVEHHNAWKSSSGSTTDESTGKATTTWNIQAYTMPTEGGRLAMVTDQIKTPSSGVTYSGKGIKVRITDIATGNQVGEETTILWENLKKTDTSWSFDFSTWSDYPNEGKYWRYDISYTTEANMSQADQSLEIKNSFDPNNDEPKEGTGTAQTPTTSRTGIQKSVANIDHTNGIVTWQITLTIPAKGFSSNKSYVEEILPHTKTYQDTYVADSFRYVSGSVAADGTPTVSGMGSTNDPLKFTWANGFARTSAQRQVIFTFQSKYDENWLKDETASNRHTNEAIFNNDHAWAEVTPVTPLFRKTGSTARIQNGEIYFDFTILTSNINEASLAANNNSITLTDTFNSHLEYVDGTAKIYGGNQEYNVGQTYVDSVPSVAVNGNTAEFTITRDNLPGVWGQAEDGSWTELDELYPFYKLTYTLKVKDADLLTAEALQSSGLTVLLNNTVISTIGNGDTTVTFTPNILDKFESGRDEDDHVEFTVKVNTAQIDLDPESDVIILTDTLTNISAKYEDIHISFPSGNYTAGDIKTLDGNGNQVDVPYFNMSGDTITFYLPDGIETLITYQTKPYGEVGDDGRIHYINEANLSGYKKTVSGDYDWSGNASGSGTQYGVKLYKADGYVNSKMVGGAKFKLFIADEVDENGNIVSGTPMKNADGTDYIVTTSASEAIEIKGDAKKQGWNLKPEQRYYLLEVEAPEGYAVTNTKYQFVISSQGYVNYSRNAIVAPDGSGAIIQPWTYYNGDVLTVKDWPKDGELILTKNFAEGSDITKLSELDDDQKAAVKFEIYSGKTEGEATTWTLLTTIGLDQFMASESGEGTYKIGDLPAGKYKVIEVVNDEACKEKTYQVVNNGDKVIAGTATEASYATIDITQDDIKNRTAHEVTITNKYEQESEFRIYKYANQLAADAQGESPKDARLKGAEFGVYAVDENNQPTGTEIETYTTNARGRFEILYSSDKYKYNTVYALKETKAPEGYKLSTDIVYFCFCASGVNSAPGGAPASTVTIPYKGVNNADIPNDVGTTSIGAEKIWKNDKLEVDSKTDSVSVKIKQKLTYDKEGKLLVPNSEKYYPNDAATYTLSKEGNAWKLSIDPSVTGVTIEDGRVVNLPTLTFDKMGVQLYYQYEVEEVVPSGYNASVEYSSDENGKMATITNTPNTVTSKTKVTAKKVWKDASNHIITGEIDANVSMTAKVYRTTGVVKEGTIIEKSGETKSASNLFALLFQKMNSHQGGPYTVSPVVVTALPNDEIKIVFNPTYNNTSREIKSTDFEVHVGYLQQDGINFVNKEDKTVSIVDGHGEITLTATAQTNVIRLRSATSEMKSLNIEVTNLTADGRTQVLTQTEAESVGGEPVETLTLNKANNWQATSHEYSGGSGTTVYSYYVVEEGGANYDAQYSAAGEAVTITNIDKRLRVYKEWFRPDGTTPYDMRDGSIKYNVYKVTNGSVLWSKDVDGGSYSQTGNLNYDTTTLELTDNGGHAASEISNPLIVQGDLTKIRAGSKLRVVIHSDDRSSNIQGGQYGCAITATGGEITSDDTVEDNSGKTRTLIVENVSANVKLYGRLNVGNPSPDKPVTVTVTVIEEYKPSETSTEALLGQVTMTYDSASGTLSESGTTVAIGKENWSSVISGLPASGTSASGAPETYTYRVEEVEDSVPENFELKSVDPSTAVSNAGSVTISNKAKPAKVRVTKVFEGLETTEIPTDFRITNNATSDVFTINNKTGGEGTTSSPYYWEIDNLLPGQHVRFYESGVLVDGKKLSVTVNGEAAELSSLAGSTQAVSTLPKAITGSDGTVHFVNNYGDQTGSLKFTKKVTVNSAEIPDTATALEKKAADGEYTFTITGPGTDGTVNKEVVIKVENGVATKYKIDNAANFSDLPTDKFAVISGLTPGEYKITETVPTNGSAISKINDKASMSYFTTVTVTAGATIAEAATATFTNNINVGSLEITKTVQLNETTDTSATGTFYYAVYNAKYDPTADPPQTPVATGSIEVTENGPNKATVSGLPYGTYYVYELTDEGGTPIVSGENGVQEVINDTIYTVTGSGTTATISSSETPASAALTNNVETIDVKVTKEWKPAPPAGTKITLDLYSGDSIETAAAATTPVTTIELDGTADGSAVNISKTDTKAGTKQENPAWTAEFMNLPKYAVKNNSGEVYEIKYVVKEVSISAQEEYEYNVSYSGDETGQTYVITGGTITNTQKYTDFEFYKEWIDISQQKIEWDQNIQVTVSRKAGNTQDASFSLIYNISKSAVEGATAGTAEFDADGEDTTNPKLKLTITEEDGIKKYNFRIERLAYASDTGDVYTYYVKETNAKLSGYLDPSYSNPSALTLQTEAYDNGIIINKQEGGYELPQTGGIGTRLFTALGGLMTATAGAILTMKSYRRRKENA